MSKKFGNYAKNWYIKCMKKTNIMKNLKLHLLTERVRLLTSFERLLKSSTP